MPPAEAKIYHSADVLFGKCDNVSATVEAVQFHGVKITKNDALLKEIGHLYTVSNLPELIRDCSLAAKHLQVVVYFAETSINFSVTVSKAGSNTFDSILHEAAFSFVGSGSYGECHSTH